MVQWIDAGGQPIEVIVEVSGEPLVRIEHRAQVAVRIVAKGGDIAQRIRGAEQLVQGIVLKYRDGARRVL